MEISLSLKTPMMIPIPLIQKPEGKLKLHLKEFSFIAIIRCSLAVFQMPPFFFMDFPCLPVYFLDRVISLSHPNINKTSAVALAL